MTIDQDWRHRLEAEIKKSGRSLRDISLSCGYGAGYLHSILTEGKDPSVSKLLGLCDNLGVSAAYVLHGIGMTEDDEKLLREINANPDTLMAVKAVISAVRRQG